MTSGHGHGRAFAILSGIVLALVLAAASWWWGWWGGDITIRIPAATIQTELERKFPWQHTYLRLAEVALSHPLLHLSGGSPRLTFSLDGTASLVGVHGHCAASATVSGVVVYDRPGRAFLLTQARIDALSIAGLSPHMTGRLVDALGPRLSAYLERQPLYHLTATDVKKAALGVVLDRVSVAQGEVVVVLGPPR